MNQAHKDGAAEGAAAAAVAGGPVVLVIDDHPPVLQALKFLLESKGYTALTAPDGETAVELCRRRHGDIAAVVTDLMMPGMDGVETIRALRKVDAGLEFIAMSGGASPREVAALEALGVKAFLQKPFGVDDLVQALRRALDDRRAPAKAP